MVQNWLLSLLRFCKSLIIKVPAEGVESTLLAFSGAKWCAPTQEFEKIGREHRVIIVVTFWLLFSL